MAPHIVTPSSRSHISGTHRRYGRIVVATAAVTIAISAASCSEDAQSTHGGGAPHVEVPTSFPTVTSGETIPGFGRSPKSDGGLPADWPKEVPVVKGRVDVLSTDSGSRTWTISVHNSDMATAVHKMTAAGFSDSSQGGSHKLSNKDYSVLIVQNGNKLTYEVRAR